MDERAINFRELLGWVRGHRVVAISALNAVAVLAVTCVVAALIETSATREVHAQIRNRPRPEPSVEETTPGDRVDGTAGARWGRASAPGEPGADRPVEVRTRRVPRAAPSDPPLTPDEDPDARLELEGSPRSELELEGLPGSEGEIDEYGRSAE